MEGFSMSRYTERTGRPPSPHHCFHRTTACPAAREASSPEKKEEILQVINENFIEMLTDMVNQNVQGALKKFQDNKNKEYEKTQKQINEIIGALNKYKSETENTTNRGINELRIKTDNIKEEVNHDMENLRKKNKTKIQNKMKGH
jgi:hypothetical protein